MVGREVGYFVTWKAGKWKMGVRIQWGVERSLEKGPLLTQSPTIGIEGSLEFKNQNKREM